MMPRFARPSRKNDWDTWDNWDTRRKTAWLSGIACPVYAFGTGTRLGHLGHFGIRAFQDGAPFRLRRLNFTRGAVPPAAIF